MHPPSDDALALIAGRASNLWERLRGGGLEAVGEIDPGLLERRLNRWREAVARGDEASFQQRLRRDGLTMHDVGRALGAVFRAASDSLPAWTAVLADVMRFPAADDEQTTFCLHPEDPLPFEDPLLAFVGVAQRRLRERAGEILSQLSPEAQGSMQRSLLINLVRICAPALQLEFSAARANPGHGPSPAGRYQTFLRDLSSGGFFSFFQSYPVAARLAAVGVECWVESAAEYLRRLAGDLPALADAFNGGLPPGCVTEIAPVASDFHRGNRSVFLLTFASGLRLVYKPKCLLMDRAFWGLLGWCNEQGLEPRLLTLNTLAREEYGWVEFIEHRLCRTREEAKLFYRRLGALGCLLVLLGGTDAGCQNLVAHGAHTVLVDLETLFHPRSADSAIPAGPAAPSVRTMGLFPQAQFGRRGRVFDCSAIGAPPSQSAGYDAPVWEQVNTDEMVLRKEERTMRHTAHLPHLSWRYVEFQPDILSGFEGAACFLRERRHALLAPGGPLERFRGQWGRFIFRPTTSYAVLLARSLHPRCLRDGADRGIELDAAARLLLEPQADPRLWGLLSEEREAMERLDVPYFRARTTESALELSGGRTLPLDAAPGFEEAAARLRGWGEAEWREQLTQIEAALAAGATRLRLGDPS